MNFRTLAFTLSTLAACSIQAYGQYPGLTITSPPQGSVFSGGQHVTITWTGGDPSWNINIALIDYNYYQVVKGVGSPPNTGSFNWIIPSDLTCGHTIGFYLESAIPRDDPHSTWTYGPTYTFVCQIPVAISIKPGSSPAPINPNSKGDTPVAILSSATFDATTAVDLTSLTFGHSGNEKSLVSCDSRGQDVNYDGIPDLVCHFHTQAAGFVSGDSAGVLKGKTTTGISIIGTGAIQIVPR